MITAGPNMSEMKLWSCKEWVCLQTLKFCCPSPSQLKMDLHSSAKFLMVADVHRKVNTFEYKYLIFVIYDLKKTLFSCCVTVNVCCKCCE